MNRKRLVPATIILVVIFLSISCVNKLIEETETYYETVYHPQQQTETYTEIETTVIETKKGRQYLRPVVKWAGYNLTGNQEINLIRYYGYRIAPLPHQRIQVKITLAPGALDDRGLITVYDLTGKGQVPVMPTEAGGYPGYWSPRQVDWFNNLNNILGNSRVLASAITGSYPGYAVSRYIMFDAGGVYEFAILADTFYYESVDMVELNWEDDIIEQRAVTRERQVTIEVPVQVEKQRTVQNIIRVPIWDLFSGN